MTLHPIIQPAPSPARNDEPALIRHLNTLMAVHHTYTPDPARNRVKVGPVWFHYDGPFISVRNNSGFPIKVGRQTPVKRQLTYAAPSVDGFMALMRMVYRAAFLVQNKRLSLHSIDVPAFSEHEARKLLVGPGWQLHETRRPFGPLGGDVYRFKIAVMKGVRLTD